MKTNFAGSFPTTPVTQPRKNVEKELFNHQATADQIIDAYEQATGLKPRKSTVKPANYEYKTKLFDMSVPEDQELFEKLMNSRQFRIIYFKDNFTARGDYKAFCTYVKDLNYVDPTPPKS